MKFLKNHPFAVEAFFKESLVLTYAAPKEELESLIPKPLSLDLYNDEYAFIAVAMVQTEALRPKGFHKLLGQNFFLIGYRVFVRHTNQKGKSLRGLYILGSETDKKSMKYLGNLFTHYRYQTIDIEHIIDMNSKKIRSKKSNFQIEYNDQIKNVNLPNFSPFKDWKEARRFAGPLPHTFTVNNELKTMLTIRGLRQNWIPKPIEVLNHRFQLIDKLEIQSLELASAFIVKNIPYSWEKGKIEKW